MLDETLESLRAAALAAGDAGGYFPALYCRVTKRVMEDAAAGRFTDSERMGTFVRGFAARYLDARNGPTAAPACWRASFAMTADASLLVVQHLLLGINAHVNFDLPQTVVDLVGETGDLTSIRSDFDGINAVLHDTYNDVIGDLDRVTHWTGKVAAMGGGHLFNFGLHTARDQAWRAAGLLHASAPDARPTEVASLDRLVSVLAYLITRPTIPFRWIAGAARRLETHDSARVTTALLGPLA